MHLFLLELAWFLFWFILEEYGIIGGPSHIDSLDHFQIEAVFLIIVNEPIENRPPNEQQPDARADIVDQARRFYGE